MSKIGDRSPGWSAETMPSRARVISDNDYCGDPDGLVQLAHLLLSPSVELPFVIGSAMADEASIGHSASAGASVLAAKRISELCGRSDVPLLSGDAAARAIVAEALSADTDLPLFVTCGGGLTAIAAAWRMEPRIAERLTLIWIGGREHPDLAEPPEEDPPVEYNTGIDFAASQVVFNQSDLRIWQVPRDAYRQILASRAELLVRMRPHGPLGRHLYDSLASTVDMLNARRMLMGETYILGDSPLVLLTALFSNFHPGPSSSASVTRPRPRIIDSGGYAANPAGPPLRIFTRLDARLVLEDLYAKLELHAQSSSATP